MPLEDCPQLQLMWCIVEKSRVWFAAAALIDSFIHSLVTKIQLSCVSIHTSVHVGRIFVAIEARLARKIPIFTKIPFLSLPPFSRCDMNLNFVRPSI